MVLSKEDELKLKLLGFDRCTGKIKDQVQYSNKVMCVYVDKDGHYSIRIYNSNANIVKCKLWREGVPISLITKLMEECNAD